MGIEPTSTAWEAVVLPMNYIRIHLDMYLTKNRGKSQGQNRKEPLFPGTRRLYSLSYMSYSRNMLFRECDER